MKARWTNTGALFGAILGAIIVYFQIKNLDLSLNYSRSIIPGQATFDGIDINKRTSAYFTHLLLPFLVSVLMFATIFPKKWANSHWINVAIKSTLAIGLGIVSIGLLTEFKFNYQPLSLVWLVIFSLFFFVKPSRFKKPKANRWKFRVLVYVGAFLLPVPLILKLFFLLIAYVWASRTIKNGFVNRHYLSIYIYPLFVLLTGILIYWTPPFVDQYELFENANPANALMRVFEFDEIPFIDFMSSHLLSEQVPLYLHGLLRGFDGSTDALAWLNIFKPLAFVTIYYFLRQTIGSASWAFATVMIFPFLTLVIPISYWLALVSVFVFFHYFKNPDWRSIAYCILWTIFLVFWRIDIAAAHIPAFAVLVLLHLIKLPHHSGLDSKSAEHKKGYDKQLLNDKGSSGQKLPRDVKAKNDLLKWSLLSFLALAIGFVTIYALNYFYDGRIAQNIDQALSYFGASQAHAYTKITSDYSSWMFMAHHFVFPCLVTLILIFTIKDWNPKGQNLSNQFLRIAIIFLSCYYFFNASRGLVRHGFIEGSDRAISSFFFLIVTLFALSKVSEKRRPWLFVMVSTVLVFVAKYGGQSTAQPLISKVADISFTQEKYDNSNVDFEPSIRKKISKTDSIVNYLNSELQEQETFFDFSNTPMLYYYAQRKVPSYFNQSQQNEVTEKIQRINLEQIEGLYIPIVVYSHYPDNWWDNTDGVPNAIRYPVLAHWIFDNYLPDTIVAGYQIWKLKSQLQPEHHHQIDEKFLYPRDWNLKYYPLLYKASKSTLNRYGAKMDSLSNRFEVAIDDAQIGDMVVFNIMDLDYKNGGNEFGKSEAKSGFEYPIEANLQFFKNGKTLGTIDFNFYPTYMFYTIPVWTQYNWHLGKPDCLIIESKTKFKIDLLSITQNVDEY
ncbi:MAG: hypothetical protein JXQ87_06795 [Bacteroidia bacterium]